MKPGALGKFASTAPEHVSLRNRIAITIAIVVAIILLLALFGYLSGGWNNIDADGFSLASAEQATTPSEYDDRIIVLEKEAADDAYRAQIQHLFATWMKDDAGQPGRAIKGANQARRAYIDVMKAVEKREEDLRKLRELRQNR